jgi:hypothetical protein
MVAEVASNKVLQLKMTRTEQSGECTPAGNLNTICQCSRSTHRAASTLQHAVRVWQLCFAMCLRE